MDILALVDEDVVYMVKSTAASDDPV